MAEPTVSDKNTSFDQRVHQAFLKAVDTIMTSGREIVTKALVDTIMASEKEMVKKAATDTIINSGRKIFKKALEEVQANDCSTAAELQSHPVAFGYEHTSIRLTPKGEEYKDDPRFKQVDELGRPYTTIGAGPEIGNLANNLDRPNDIGPHPNRIPIGLKDCKKELMVIETLLGKNENFQPILDYDVNPKIEVEQSPFWADDGYNSNSYISGLIDAAGLKKPLIDTKTHPGWDKPVPSHHFWDNDREWSWDQQGAYLSKDHKLIGAWDGPGPYLGGPGPDLSKDLQLIEAPEQRFTVMIMPSKEEFNEMFELHRRIKEEKMKEQIKNFPKSEAFKKITEQIDSVKNSVEEQIKSFPKL